MRILKSVTGENIPQIRIYVDTETWAQKSLGDFSETHTFRLGYCCVVKENGHGVATKYGYALKRKEDLFRIIDMHVFAKRKAWIFCHNYNFDALVLDLFGQLKQNRYEIQRWIIDSDMFIVTAKGNEKSLAFIDSFNYFKTSIAKMGDILGKQKIKVDFDHVSDTELMRYCQNDTEILRDFMETFISWWRNGHYGNFRYTMAGLALEAYRHRFMRTDIWLHDVVEAQKLELESYRGGRAEAFFIGKPSASQFYKLDINSMYPYVMAHNTFPVALSGIKSNLTHEQIAKLCDKYLVVADVEYTAYDTAISVRRERLINPVGRIRATLCTPELKYLLGRGIINKVHICAFYRHANIFADYINHFYIERMRFRAEKNSIMDTFAKLFMNSLYGKFGQQNTQYELLGDSWLEHNCIQHVIGDNYSGRETEIHLNGKVYRRVGSEISETAFVAIASHVTAYARMLLWKYINTAGYRNCYYCDTDSLFVNQKGYERLAKFIDSNELGKLKLESVSDYLEIRNVKDYTFGNETKRKGVRKDAIEVTQNVFRQTRFSKIRSMLNANTDNAVLVEQIEKRLSTEYKKGEKGKGGWVRPFCLHEG